MRPEMNQRIAATAANVSERISSAGFMSRNLKIKPRYTPNDLRSHLEKWLLGMSNGQVERILRRSPLLKTQVSTRDFGRDLLGCNLDAL